MGKYDENISDNSIWITATPTPLTQKFPFYVTEAGHFAANKDYVINRTEHDSFLLLYTCSGIGCITSNNISIQLPSGHAAIINCHLPHEYFTQSDKWEFLWIHFNGAGAEALFDIIYPDSNIRTVNMKNVRDFENELLRLINMVLKNDVKSCIDISSEMHSVLNSVYTSTIADEETNRKKETSDDIQAVISFIEKNYSSPISVDDMVNIIHISKYHFIRRFSRTMGITPYHYLTNHRITMAKTFLRSTDKTVAEIAEICGFLDTSNFITQFKKQTGQKPLQYRRSFS